MNTNFLATCLLSPLQVTFSMTSASCFPYAADNGTQIRWGWKFVQENRLGGMLDYKNSMRDQMREKWDQPGTLYGSKIRNRGANGYFKIGTQMCIRDRRPAGR